MTTIRRTFATLAVLQALLGICLLPFVLTLNQAVPNPHPVGGLIVWGMPIAMIATGTLAIWLLQRDNVGATRSGIGVAAIFPIASTVVFAAYA